MATSTDYHRLISVSNFGILSVGELKEHIVYEIRRDSRKQFHKRIQFLEPQRRPRSTNFFRLSTLAEATNHFAISNKLGQGGLGPVFKGVLQDGQEIAVKCLLETSKQGIN
ncbi:hypothetical protein POM88_010825 [Heracleum sosnowskyi]|uniref:Protein kinase domain-containing protein n=1 Tax=Heracleum sosnowskyi TaxID=360622 RepID=A0AAD8IV43_9APIA|nr:hypothetical protein POM88_010825 [Heracleum sosnowskyi]